MSRCNVPLPLPEIKGNSPLEIALDCARQGWRLLPLRPSRLLRRHKRWRCPDQEPICLKTGWHALPLESYCDMTRNEETIREWWTDWPDAAIGLMVTCEPGLKNIRPVGPGAKALCLVVLVFDGYRVNVVHAEELWRW